MKYLGLALGITVAGFATVLLSPGPIQPPAVTTHRSPIVLFQSGHGDLWIEGFVELRYSMLKLLVRLGEPEGEGELRLEQSMHRHDPFGKVGKSLGDRTFDTTEVRLLPLDTPGSAEGGFSRYEVRGRPELITSRTVLVANPGSSSPGKLLVYTSDDTPTVILLETVRHSTPVPVTRL